MVLQTALPRKTSPIFGWTCNGLRELPATSCGIPSVLSGRTRPRQKLAIPCQHYYGQEDSSWVAPKSPHLASIGVSSESNCSYEAIRHQSSSHGERHMSEAHPASPTNHDISTNGGGAMKKEQWEFLLGDWQDCRESELGLRQLRLRKGGRRGFTVRASYDKNHDCLHWPSRRNGGFTLRWHYKSNQQPANEWMRLQEVEERAQLQRKRPLEEEPGDTDTLCEVLASSLDLESLELDNSRVFFQIVSCGKDRYMSHHMQEQAIVFDVRNFNQPAAGNLKRHDGRHDEIIDRSGVRAPSRTWWSACTPGLPRCCSCQDRPPSRLCFTASLNAAAPDRK